MTVLNTYTIGEQVAGGFADVTFGDAHGWQAHVHLSLVLRLDDAGWRIRQWALERGVRGERVVACADGRVAAARADQPGGPPDIT
ncbi:hypothetical protein [Streptomyces nigrescens]